MHPPVDEHALDELLEHAADALRAAGCVAVLTGAGVSAESGLPTFRGADGLWEGHRVEEVATPFAFERDPTLVWRFYNARRASLRSVRPNPGHHALVALEEHVGRGHFALITQNVDGLHRSAGSRHVLELHGSLARIRCTGCGQVEERGDALDDLPRCLECNALLRPDVVWFYEALPEVVWQEAEDAVCRCQCLLVAGTSAIVHPAAGLIATARAGGARVIEVNLATTEASRLADVCLRGPSGELLPRLLKKILPEGRLPV